MKCDPSGGGNFPGIVKTQVYNAQQEIRQLLIDWAQQRGAIDPADFWHGVMTHVVALGDKDLGFAIELAEQLDVDVPLARQARSNLSKGLGI